MYIFSTEHRTGANIYFFMILNVSYDMIVEKYQKILYSHALDPLFCTHDYLYNSYKRN